MPIPASFRPYRKSPVFDAANVPQGLLRAHATAAGVWAEIHVVEGRLRYVIEASGASEVLEPGRVGVVEPQILHHVEPLGDVRFYVEFFRADAS